jgi:hypothetical protein
MDVRQQVILDYLVTYWREQFNLVPAAVIAEAFELPEAETLDILEAMAREGVVELHRQQAGPADPGAAGRSAPKAFRATYVLASRSILKTRFAEAQQDFGLYRNFLIQGVGQATLFRFRPAVLDLYRQNPNVEVKADLVVSRPAALAKADAQPVYVRYRWATGPPGERYLLVNLWDLAELSREDQQIWAQHEIEELREDAA